MRGLRNVAIVFLCLALVFSAAGCAQKDIVPPSTVTDISEITPCNDSTPTFSWSPATDNDSGMDYYLVSVDGGDWINIGDETEYALTSAVADGSHTFTIKAVDKAGNEGEEGTCTYTCDTVAPSISDVSVSITSFSNATVTWTTSENATSQVEYGSTTSYGSLSTLDSCLVTAHSVELSGLPCSYHFRVRSRDACGNEGISWDCVFIEGQLPALKTGDTWTYEMASDSVYYTLTQEVSGGATVNGKDCWVIEESYVPPFFGVDCATERVEKTTWLTLHSQAIGTYAGIPFTIAMTFSYQVLHGSFWPLEVGNELRVAETTTTTITLGGESSTTTETRTLIYKVEAIEQITVQAGEFRCFKIVEYNEFGSQLARCWYSAKAKNYVKYVDVEDGITLEMKSYSV